MEFANRPKTAPESSRSELSTNRLFTTQKVFHNDTEKSEVNVPKIENMNLAKIEE